MRPRFFLSSSKTWILEKNDTPPKVESSEQLSAKHFDSRSDISRAKETRNEISRVSIFCFQIRQIRFLMESICVKGWKVRDGMLRTIRVKV